MRFSFMSGAALFGLATTVVAAPAPAGDTVDTTPFEKFKFTTTPFTDDMAKKGAAIGESPFSRASQNAVGASGCQIREEFHRTSDANRRAFANAIRCLYSRPSRGGYPGSQNRWEDLVSVHQRLTPQIHMLPIFLPYHRYYLAIFESMIRDECGYRGPMLWWDETLDAGNFRNSIVFQDAYFSRAAARTSNGQGTCVTTGTFANIQLNIGPGTGYTRHCLSRAIDENLTRQCNANFVNYCNSMGNYKDMEQCSEMGPHAYGHNGIGSVMSDVYASPEDPVFFLHHGFIDRNWYRWQNADPANRMYQVAPGLTLDKILSSYNLRGQVRVRDMMDTRGGFLCYEYDY